MYAVIVQTIESTETIRVYGPYRSKERAERIKTLCRDPGAAEYFDYEDHMVWVAALSTYDRPDRG